ncbi:helix-turn-helix domain-containing protein [Leyella stercorea]
MDRIEFSQMLVLARERIGLGKNEMCRQTGYTFVQLQLLETKPNNFAMNKAFHYLDSIGMILAIDKDGNSTKLNDIESIATWLKTARNGIYTQRSLAEAVGCTYPTIANIERGSNKVTVDNFLKLADTLGYTIKIEQK